MEEIKKMLLNIQLDMKSQETKILKMEESITKTINDNINDKFTYLEQKNKDLEEKIEGQEKKIEYLERENRKKNLIFFGVEEKENSYLELELTIIQIIRDELKINCEKSDLEAIKRLGKKTGKIRPVLVTLLTLGKKIMILKNKKNLEGTGIYLKEDYSAKVLATRKLLMVELEKERNNGKQAILRYDKIIYLNTKTEMKKRPFNSNKRNFSNSPEERKKLQKTEENRPGEKNKPTSIKSFCYSTKGNKEVEKNLNVPVNIDQTHSG